MRGVAAVDADHRADHKRAALGAWVANWALTQAPDLFLALSISAVFGAVATNQVLAWVR